MIIDSHAHLGTCRVFDITITADELLRGMDANGVDASLVLPLPGAPDSRRVHDDIAELALRHPGRIFGVISLNPHCDDDAYYAESARCASDLGFVGLKLHPLGHACSPTSRDAAKVFEAARALRLPIIVHTGAGAPFALPSLVIPRAQQYPDVKIVLAHSGAHLYAGEAIVAGQVCPNIYLETSWCGSIRVRDFITALGPQRVMFGADLPANVANELLKFHTEGIDPSAQEICLGRTAMDVFGIRP